MGGNVQIIGEVSLPDPEKPFSGVTTTVVSSKKALDVAVISGGSSQSFATIVDEASSTITYVGKANPGSAESAASWQIQRIETSGSLTIIKWANGNADFDKVWNNRASLTYS